MDAHADAERLAADLAVLLARALPPSLAVRADGAALVFQADTTGDMVVPLLPFDDEAQLVEAIADALLAGRDEACAATHHRYEREVVVDAGAVRIWFGRLQPTAARRPWRSRLPELPPLPLARFLTPVSSPGGNDISPPTIAARRSVPYAGDMSGIEPAAPVRSMTLVGRRTRGYHVEMYRVSSGFGFARRGRRTIVRLGSLRLEWYPK